MSPASRRWRRTAAVVSAFLAGLMAVSACSSNSGSSPGLSGQGAASGDEGAPMEPGAAPDPNTNAGGEKDEQGNGGSDPATVEPVTRAIIYTATVQVTSEDVVKAADDGIRLVVAAGGIVSADQRSLDDDRSTVQLVFRVPAEKFTATLEALANLGDEQSRQVQTDDVTDQIIDLDARVATQQASVDRVRSLLARANTIGEIVALESELARREADLDSLKQRRAKLGGLVALSTITLVLYGPAVEPPPIEERTGFIAGLEDGWAAFLASVKVVLTVAGFMLPWLLAIGLPLWLILFLTRRRRRTAPPAPPTPPAVPATLPKAPPPPQNGPDA